MFKKVLVANRGEIAARIIRTLKKMNITAIAVYSIADKYAPYVAMADESYLLGPAIVSESYLNIAKIIEIIKLSKADAVHPGYGLLSENPKFFEALNSEGIAFIGPSLKHLKSFGLKDEARKLAKSAGVPLVPGTDLINTVDEALEAAHKIGYPIMLKAAAGGGGIGMQRCTSDIELRSNYESVINLARKNFANSNIYMEKCIDRARHIEVQIFGDGQGQVLTLGERDCSLQRRHQKVVEETPAPNLSSEIRLRMSEAARALAVQHQYMSAGTVEFIYDCDNQEFYFLEVNTRLQVEHTVTEEVFKIDLVEWMILLAAGDLSFWPTKKMLPEGHAIQARIYAEDPIRNFMPCTGEISHWSFGGNPRIDSAVEKGQSVTSYYDPLLAKVIVKAKDRESAITALKLSLEQAVIGGVQTNTAWLVGLIDSNEFKTGTVCTYFTKSHHYFPAVVEVLRPGIQTTVQDHPGRVKMWDVGVPPSGPMDAYSFQLGNSLLQNDDQAAGLECLIHGPKLKFHLDTAVCVTGAYAEVKLNNVKVAMWKTIAIKAGDILDVGKVLKFGNRIYILIAGGIQTPDYLNSRSTFTLGKFGGHCGRPLLLGDSLPLALNQKFHEAVLNAENIPSINSNWEIHVLMGPHTSPDFFTCDDVEEIVNSTWKVHFNSDRTGVRLIGPQPKWAREDGGEAGLHPSNLHDNAYAIGAMDFTGDQPVLLGPDGPSLGGFVCPLTIINADLWKMGQLRSDDTVKFIPVSYQDSLDLLNHQNCAIKYLNTANSKIQAKAISISSPILFKSESEPKLVIRQSGDSALLCEFGIMQLDIQLRIHVHFLMLRILENHRQEITECTPGIRSIQIQFDPKVITREKMIANLINMHEQVVSDTPNSFESRIVHLPLAWDDPSTQIAIDKYVNSVRPNAPWCCPNNIEFIRRINGLSDVSQVKDIVYNASYLVMGLGDVYLGAPVAVPLDPRHRLVTTKYNPARTWTPENAVGIGGTYMCIYGMEGPGGYQFVGRTLPIWNRFQCTDSFEKPYLLRFFDQIKFYEVSPQELLEQREAFLHGQYKIKIESTRFDIKAYEAFLIKNAKECAQFKQMQSLAFQAEKQRWIEKGEFTFDSNATLSIQSEKSIPLNATPIISPVSGVVWKILAEQGAQVKEEEVLFILESMKMEMGIVAPSFGLLKEVFIKTGQTVQAGQKIGYIV